METILLGQSDIAISPPGPGTWAIAGNGWEDSWGPQDDQEAIATTRTDRGLERCEQFSAEQERTYRIAVAMPEDAGTNVPQRRIA